MILCFDVGNTLIGIGVYFTKEIVDSYSVYTDRKKSADEYATIFRNLFLDKNYKIEGAIISSVVPELTGAIKNAIIRSYKIEPLLVDSKIKTKIAIKIDNPSELGADLLSDSVGAVNKYGFPILIADLGTASKIIVIDSKGSYAGGVIFPGVNISYESLTNSTSLLTNQECVLPEKVCGKNTKDSVNSGILNGQIESIKGISKAIENEYGYSFKKVLTGGYSKIIKDHLTDFIYDEHLILDGLINIYFYNKR
jgi:type III pantothenate kinase